MRGFSLIEILISLFVFSLAVFYSLTQDYRIKIQLQQADDQHLALQAALNIRDLISLSKAASQRLYILNHSRDYIATRLLSASPKVYLNHGRVFVCWQRPNVNCVSLGVSKL